MFNSSSLSAVIPAWTAGIQTTGKWNIPCATLFHLKTVVGQRLPSLAFWIPAIHAGMTV